MGFGWEEGVFRHASHGEACRQRVLSRDVLRANSVEVGRGVLSGSCDWIGGIIEAMSTLPNTEELWTVREYLRTSWSPDREYVNGRIEERNLGEKEHSILQ
jgi:hypothetical protein